MCERLYSKEHTWIDILDNIEIRIGLTEFAQHGLGEIVFVELPQLGAKVVAGQSIGTIESEKTVVDLYAPVSGKVVEVNSVLTNAPNIINTDPYDEGWMVVIQVTDIKQFQQLLTTEQYLNLC